MIDARDIIRNVFQDTRTFEVCGKNMFEDKYGEIVLLKEHKGDFDTEALASYTCEVEDICREHGGHVGLYILMDPDGAVKVHERTIPSDMDFTIKLAITPQPDNDLEFTILEQIKRKIANETYSEKDIKRLQKLPLECKEKNRMQIRKEVFDILEEIM